MTQLNRALLEILACPCEHHAAVEYLPDENELVCERCQKRFEVRDGIPIMLLDAAKPPRDAEAEARANVNAPGHSHEHEQGHDHEPGHEHRTGFAATALGVLQRYEWGGQDGLRAWAPDPNLNPQAELWYGDHVRGDSPVLQHFSDVASANDEIAITTLSQLTLNDAPLMLKLISCARTLSIQVHPDQLTAKAGMSEFLTDSGAPVLVDGRGKDEMLLALSQFDLLAGFVAAETGAAILRDFGGAFDSAADAYQAGQTGAAIKMVMQKSVHQMKRLTPLLPPELVADLGSEVIDTADPTLVVAALMQRVRLYPGEAIHVPPGTWHAYLGGTGIELMTASDNVLRVGLTSKPKAVEAAITLLKDDSVREIPPKFEDGVKVFEPAGAPFALRDLVAQEPSSFEVPAASYQIVLALDGPCQILTSFGELDLEIGQAGVVSEPATNKARPIVVKTSGRAVAGSYLAMAN